MWADQALAKLSDKKIYHRDDLRHIISSEGINISESTFRWTLYNWEKNQKLFRVGYDSYMTVRPEILPIYRPVYSKKSLKLMKLMKDKYSTVNFVIYESFLLNEFLNHQIAQNTIYIQVEKDVSYYIFDKLRDLYSGVILYKPDRIEFYNYWKRDCIVVLDLVSQYPALNEYPHEIVPEKLLVDIIADKSIAATFSPSELPYIYKNFFDSYQIDERRLRRYAGRRGKTDIVEKYMRGI